MDQLVEALQTSAGMLWKALWALIFGYIISAGIQVLVRKEQMAKALGERGGKQIGLAGFFGFITSSCSFAALAASQSILRKALAPSTPPRSSSRNLSRDRARHRCWCNSAIPIWIGLLGGGTPKEEPSPAE